MIWVKEQADLRAFSICSVTSKEALIGFTVEYLKRCWKSRQTWTEKNTFEGDWYLAGDPLELQVVGHSDLDAISFADSSIAYVPDTDDLLEIIDNQITDFGGDPEEKVIRIDYNPDDGWSIRVKFADAETVAMRQESIHSLLVQVMFQMAQPPP